MSSSTSSTVLSPDWARLLHPHIYQSVTHNELVPMPIVYAQQLCTFKRHAYVFAGKVKPSSSSLFDTSCFPDTHVTCTILKQTLLPQSTKRLVNSKRDRVLSRLVVPLSTGWYIQSFGHVPRAALTSWMWPNTWVSLDSQTSPYEHVENQVALLFRDSPDADAALFQQHVFRCKCRQEYHMLNVCHNVTRHDYVALWLTRALNGVDLHTTFAMSNNTLDVLSHAYNITFLKKNTNII